MQYLFVNVGFNNELHRIEQLSLDFWITSKKSDKKPTNTDSFAKKNLFFFLFYKIVCVFEENEIGMFP